MMMTEPQIGEWLTYMMAQMQSLVPPGEDLLRMRMAQERMALEGLRTRGLTEPRLILTSVWGAKSWLVVFLGPYAQDRPPHVELRASKTLPWPREAQAGRDFPLSRPFRKGGTIQRRVWGIYVSGEITRPAHITVHVGDRAVEDFLMETEPRDMGA